MDSGGLRDGTRTDTALSCNVAPAGPSSQWDDFLRRARGDLVQSSAWADFKQSLGMSVMRVVVRSGESVVAGAQVVVRTLAPRVRIGYVPFGPVIAPDAPAGTCDAIVSTLQSLRLAACFVQLPYGYEHVTTTLAVRGFRPSRLQVAPSASIRIDLRATEDELLAQMARHTRREIRCRASNDIEVRCGTGSDLDPFYRLYRATAGRQRFTPLPRRYFGALWNALEAGGNLRLFIAAIDGRDVAANIVTSFGTTVTGKFVGFDPTGVPRRYRPNEKLVWTIMTWAKANGHDTLDVGGLERSEAIRLLEGVGVVDPFEPHKFSYGGTPVVAPPPLQRITSPLVRAGYRAMSTQRWQRLRFSIESVARAGN